MPRKCSICQHVARVSIDKSLINGEPLRNIAGRYAVSTSALHRHKERDLPKALVKASKAEEIARSDSLLEQVRSLAERAERFSVRPSPMVIFGLPLQLYANCGVSSNYEAKSPAN